jgi:quercetin dioxygenase-like cupin family protein
MATAPRPALERDAVKVDPKHYKVEFESDRFRVIRIHYGPKEKSPMHQHLPGIAVMLTDCHAKFTYPDGRSEEIHKKAGEFISSDEPWEHQPENLANELFEALILELKK